MSEIFQVAEGWVGVSSALLSEVRVVKTPAAGRQPKHVVSHLPFVEGVASCTILRQYYSINSSLREYIYLPIRVL